ncbi:MAG: tetraacyldisaccharide 4'-kinase [Bacteroidota bacterium]
MNIKKIVLFPFAIIYGLITSIRNLLYDYKILKSKSFDIRTICVGNLAVGGTGKTPHVEYLINLLKIDTKIAILSRGYKRKTKGFVLASNHSVSSEIGDEPLLFKTKNPELIVAVDENRVNGIKNLQKLHHDLKLIILDDAFQHRAVTCELNIIVSEYSNLYIHDLIMPAGQLRESKKEIARADMIIISKTPENISALEIKNITKQIKPLPHQSLFFSWLKYGEIYGFQNRKETIHTLADLFRYRIVLFTGIANPFPMLTYLKEYASEVKHIQYGDHHHFTLENILEIRRLLDSFTGGNKIIVTTEKDAMRLKGSSLEEIANSLPLYILPIEIDFKNKTNDFNQYILDYLRTTKFYHKKYSA